MNLVITLIGHFFQFYRTKNTFQYISPNLFRISEGHMLHYKNFFRYYLRINLKDELHKQVC